ncbi:MAG TPA: UDP-N-acetylmuramoyl-tripeptide--D-alanyl-D-alanine ligase [Candidatus Goldiibacteriota bacterium]|nr:UDP-N-acetylmuramoyl-tripeptide--D-alanyl-D-alanine ligase [Candidatus Goldiibacteriota bacterium]
MRMNLSEVYSLFGARFKDNDVPVKGVTADTRNIKKGFIFFAIKGEKNDGHLFAAEAVKKGALVCVTEKKIKGLPCIVVPDTKEAIMNLGRYYAAKFNNLKAAAITGSNGKTTTKELLADFLQEAYVTRKNEKSFNNYLGVPLTLFGLDNKTQALVLEMGMNHKGEIIKLARLAPLDAVIITNIGRAHIGNMGSRDAIAGAKAEIFEGLKKGGTAVLNGDDGYFKFLSAKAGHKVVSFGTGLKADYRISSVKESVSGTKFSLNGIKMDTKLKGIHNIYNIAAAAAAAGVLGVDLKKVKKALKTFSMRGLMRFEEIKVKGASVINDSYNANPDSYAASLMALKQMKRKNLVIVSGDMLELGKNSRAMHTETGAKIAQIKPSALLIYGEFARDVEKGYLKSGGKAKPECFTDLQQLKKALMPCLKKGNTVFLKGSRGNKLEELIK